MGISRRDLLCRAAPIGLVALSARDALADTVTYQYDALGRVIQATYSGGITVLYTYDAAGNRTEVVRTDGSPYSATLAITGSSPVNLRTLANQNGYSGITNATITFQLGSGVTIMGAFSGGTGIDTGTWPSATKSISLALEINGNVYGGGGQGGIGSDINLYSGSGGGDAIACHENISITVNAGGSVKGGGGGGGGGGGWMIDNGGGEWESFRQGGGGGGGFPNGFGGDGAHVGATGTTSGGGAGGAASAGPRPSGAGGAGGGPAASGAFGSASSGMETAFIVKTSPGGVGQGGYAIRKNGKTVSVTNNGTIVGTQA